MHSEGLGDYCCKVICWPCCSALVLVLFAIRDLNSRCSTERIIKLFYSWDFFAACGPEESFVRIRTDPQEVNNMPICIILFSSWDFVSFGGVNVCFEISFGSYGYISSDSYRSPGSRIWVRVRTWGVGFWLVFRTRIYDKQFVGSRIFPLQLNMLWRCIRSVCGVVPVKSGVTGMQGICITYQSILTQLSDFSTASTPNDRR